MSVQLCCVRDDWAAQKREESRTTAIMTDREREGQQPKRRIHTGKNQGVSTPIKFRDACWPAGQGHPPMSHTNGGC